MKTMKTTNLLFMKNLYTTFLNPGKSFKTTLRLVLLSLTVKLILIFESFFQPYANYYMGGTPLFISWQNTSRVYDVSTRKTASIYLSLRSLPISEDYRLTNKYFS
jgi:hypothetical protein